MQITIDTKNDSKEDLRRLVNLLNSIINDENNSVNFSNESNSKQNDEIVLSEGMFSMFENEENKPNSEEKSTFEDKNKNKYTIMPY